MKSIIIPLIAISAATISCKPAKTETTAAPASAVSAKAYPLDVCIVSDEKLGSMGAPYVTVHEGQEIKFCCKSCLPDFEKEPAKYLSKLK